MSLFVFFCCYLYVRGSGLITSVGEERANLSACNYVVSVWRDFFFLWVLGMGYVILLWHPLSLPYNYFTLVNIILFPFFSLLSYVALVFYVHCLCVKFCTESR